MAETASLIDEQVFDTSTHVKALMAELRWRHSNEVFERAHVIHGGADSHQRRGTFT